MPNVTVNLTPGVGAWVVVPKTQPQMQDMNRQHHHHLSRYEIARLARLDRNERKLQELGLSPSTNDACSPLLQFSEGKGLRNRGRKRGRAQKNSSHTDGMPGAANSAPKRRSNRRKTKVCGDPVGAAKRWIASHGFDSKINQRKDALSARLDSSSTRNDQLVATGHKANLGLPSSESELAEHEHDAFQGLLAWKRARCKEMGWTDPCLVCHNRTLCEIVRLLPVTTHDLMAVWGIGKKRVQQHGPLMLAALEPFRAALEERRQEAAGVGPTTASTSLERAQWWADGGSGGKKLSNSVPPATVLIGDDRPLPCNEEGLEDYEKEAFFALREWKRARGRELGCAMRRAQQFLIQFADNNPNTCHRSLQKAQCAPRTVH